MQSTSCEGCGKAVPAHDTVHFGSGGQGSRQLCSQCFNQAVASLCHLGGFENTRFEPMTLADCEGTPHEFHVRVHWLPAMVSLEAIEIRGGEPDGYAFQVIGDSGDDLLALLGRLVEKIRRALSVKHLQEDDRHGLQIAEQQVVRGRIETDRDGWERQPLLVIDGRNVTWQEMGGMLAAYEGWQFKLEIRDQSEDL